MFQKYVVDAKEVHSFGELKNAIRHAKEELLQGGKVSVETVAWEVVFDIHLSGMAVEGKPWGETVEYPSHEGFDWESLRRCVKNNDGKEVAREFFWVFTDERKKVRFDDLPSAVSRARELHAGANTPSVRIEAVVVASVAEFGTV